MRVQTWHNAFYFWVGGGLLAGPFPSLPSHNPLPFIPPPQFWLERLSLELYFLLDVNMLFKKKYLNIYISTLEVVLFKRGERETQCGSVGADRLRWAGGA